ncbi:MAG: WecB/TagA/CpsF family glycosyltransferase [Flavobacteriales bacterium]|nr:WecB/TagA/CpsF family glycosyltransferase [Flavobacteriales bacterium]
MNTVDILNTKITETSVSQVSKKLINQSGLKVAICNTNTVVRCYKNISLSDIINNFDIKTPDGFPIAKSSALLYKNNQKRVDGYKVFLSTIEAGLDKKISHYFFGSNKNVLEKLTKELRNMFPEINILGSYAPPYDTYQNLANKSYVEDILEKRPDIVWVSLGFPKQELFIDFIHKEYSIRSNLVGVGAVFEWVSGTRIKAPEFIANIGLEWVLRLIQEPKRLYKRYFVDNFLFIFLIIKQSLSKKIK